MYASRAALPSELPWNSPHRIAHGEWSAYRFAESETECTASSLGRPSAGNAEATTRLGPIVSGPTAGPIRS